MEQPFVYDTPRGRVSDRVRKLWRGPKGTEPDDDISDVVERAEPSTGNEDKWIEAARAQLGW